MSRIVDSSGFKAVYVLMVPLILGALTVLVVLAFQGQIWATVTLLVLAVLVFSN